MSDEWRESAACKGEGVARFFTPENNGRGDKYAKAKAVCAGCSVSAECLIEAFSAPNVEGVWAGFVFSPGHPEGRRQAAERLATHRIREKPVGNTLTGCQGQVDNGRCSEGTPSPIGDDMAAHLQSTQGEYLVKTHRGYVGHDAFNVERFDLDEYEATPFSTLDGARSAAIRSGGRIYDPEGNEVDRRRESRAKASA